MNRLKIAFAGFRHDHIRSLYDLSSGARRPRNRSGLRRRWSNARQAEQSGKVDVTHTCLDSMLDVESNIIAVGEYFTKRGEVAIRALQSGRHVIVDKPLCTQMEAVEQMAVLSAEHSLKIGCMLTMRDTAQTLGHDSSFKRDALAKYTPFPLVASTLSCSTHAQRGILKRASTEAP